MNIVIITYWTHLGIIHLIHTHAHAYGKLRSVRNIIYKEDYLRKDIGRGEDRESIEGEYYESI